MSTGNVYGYMKENNEVLSGIPEWYITKSGQEPAWCPVPALERYIDSQKKIREAEGRIEWTGQ